MVLTIPKPKGYPFEQDSQTEQQVEDDDEGELKFANTLLHPTRLSTHFSLSLHLQSDSDQTSTFESPSLAIREQQTSQQDTLYCQKTSFPIRRKLKLGSDPLPISFTLTL